MNYKKTKCMNPFYSFSLSSPLSTTSIEDKISIFNKTKKATPHFSDITKLIEIIWKNFYHLTVIWNILKEAHSLYRYHQKYQISLSVKSFSIQLSTVSIFLLYSFMITDIWFDKHIYISLIINEKFERCIYTQMVCNLRRVLKQ